MALQNCLIGVWLAFCLLYRAHSRVIFQDTFSSGAANSSIWNNTTGAVVGGLCSPTLALLFNEAGSRQLITNPMDLTPWTGAVTLSGYFRLGNGGSCEPPDANEEVVLYYLNATDAWVRLFTYEIGGSFQTSSMVPFTITIPTAAKHSTSQFRWVQASHNGAGLDVWVIGPVSLSVSLDGTAISGRTQSCSATRTSSDTVGIFTECDGYGVNGQSLASEGCFSPTVDYSQISTNRVDQLCSLQGMKLLTPPRSACGYGPLGRVKFDLTGPPAFTTGNTTGTITSLRCYISEIPAVPTTVTPTAAPSPAPSLTSVLPLRVAETFRIEVYALNRWGTVCSRNFDNTDAAVACRQMGLPTSDAAAATPANQTNTSTFNLDNVNCTGSEAALSQCPHLNATTHGCTSPMDAGVVCSSGARTWLYEDFEDSTTPYMVSIEGGVVQNEVCQGSSSAILFNGTGTRRGTTRIFNLLGYPSAALSFRINLGKSSADGCTSVAANASVRLLASTDGVEWSVVHTFNTTSNFSLASGPGVEYNSFKYTVPAELMTQPAVSFRWEQPVKSSSGDFWVLDNILLSSDVGIIITPSPTAAPTPSPTPASAAPALPIRVTTDFRLQVFENGAWGTVCRDAFDALDAEVACRQMGLTGGSVVSSLPPTTDQDSGFVLMDNVACNGTEAALSQCPHLGRLQHNCDHTQDVGVTCGSTSKTWLDINFGTGVPSSVTVAGGSPSPTCGEQDGDVLMFSGTPTRSVTTSALNMQGYPTATLSFDLRIGASAECKVVSATGSVVLQYSTDGSTWSTLFTFTASSIYATSAVAMPHVTFPINSTLMLAPSLQFRWIQPTFTQQSEYWAVNNIKLSTDPDTTGGGTATGDICDGSIRLIGTSADRGRLEINFNGEWGSVCDDGFDAIAAKVACRQLGYFSGSTYALPVADRGTGRIWLDQLQCNGDEKLLRDCTSDALGTHNCGHAEDVGLQCSTFQDTAINPCGARILYLESFGSSGDNYTAVGATVGTICGSVLGNGLYFNAPNAREFSTTALNLAGVSQATVSFFLRLGSGGRCEKVDPGEDVVLTYQHGTSSTARFELARFTHASTAYASDTGGSFVMQLPSHALASNVIFTLSQVQSGGLGTDMWGIDNFQIATGTLSTVPTIYTSADSSSINYTLPAASIAVTGLAAQTYSLPFYFYFFDTRVDTIRISPYGYVLLQPTSRSLALESSNSVDLQANMLAVYWGSYPAEVAAEDVGISTETTGSSPNRLVTVTWTITAAGGNNVVFQLVLSEECSGITYKYINLAYNATASLSFNWGATQTIGLRGVGAATIFSHQNASSSRRTVSAQPFPCSALSTLIDDGDSSSSIGIVVIAIVVAIPILCMVLIACFIRSVKAAKRRKLRRQRSKSEGRGVANGVQLIVPDHSVPAPATGDGPSAPAKSSSAANLYPTEYAQPPPAVILSCSACFAHLAAGTKVCTTCGTPVGQGQTPGSPGAWQAAPGGDVEPGSGDVGPGY